MWQALLLEPDCKLIIYLIVVFSFCSFFSWADVKSRHLPNKAILMLFFFQSSFLLINNLFYWQSLALVSFIGVLLYLIKVVAAGDVKLAFTMALTVQPEYLGTSAFIMVLVGGLQSAYYLVKHCFCLHYLGESDVLKNGLPYGVAISIGFFVGILLSLNLFLAG